MKIHELNLGSKIDFVPCGECAGKHRCFFCKKGVKTSGSVVALWLDFEIPTIEVKVKGSKDFLELTQDDLDDPCLIKRIES